MADETTLDIPTLLAPIPGDQPQGDERAYPYRLREQLLTLRQEEREEDFEEATRPPQLKRADFSAIVRIATKALVEETKDLRIACHLIEALTRTRGFAGLKDGLCLLKRLLDECWDRLAPSIDDGDLEVRSSPIMNLLDDPARGFCFPNAVRQTPVIAGQSVLAWQTLLAKRSEADNEQQITLVQAKATPEALTEPKATIEGCLEELTGLVQVMDERLGENSPSLINLRTAVEDAQRLVQSLLPRTVAAAPSPVASANESSNNAPPAAASPGNWQGLIGAREQVYAQLTQAAATLAQLEPHSPIPYLVRRAVELGKLPFPQLVQQLVREEHILADLQREFGLGASQPSKQIQA